MAAIEVDTELLRQFEAGLDPLRPEASPVPAKILGYGEMSTTFQIAGTDGEGRYAYKRLPLFKTLAEATDFERLYRRYVDLLVDDIGVQVVPSATVSVASKKEDIVVLFIVQEMLSAKHIGNNLIRSVPAQHGLDIIRALLEQMATLFTFNEQHRDQVELGLDGQISNWAIYNYDPEAADWPDQLQFVYFDTGTPLLRLKGEEQLPVELFLRVAPPYLAWILRMFFLDDVMRRYYDFRSVAIDLLANLLKEGRADLVAPAAALINDYFATSDWAHFSPISAKEVHGYYREDAWIWRLYLAFRRFDRGLHRLFGRPYPHILPGNIAR